MAHQDCIYPKRTENNKSERFSFDLLNGMNPNEMISIDKVADLVIDSFNKGKDIGEKGQCIKAVKQLKGDVNYVIELVKKFTEEINKNSSILNSAFIRFTFPNRYQLLYAMNEDAYFDDAISEPVYEKSWKVSDESEEKGKHLEILFIPKTESLNTNSIIADGYINMY